MTRKRVEAWMKSGSRCMVAGSARDVEYSKEIKTRAIVGWKRC